MFLKGLGRRGQLGIIAIIVILIIIGVGAYFIYNGGYSVTPSNGSTMTGRVLFVITDAAEDLEGVSAINVEVSKVEMHASGGAWVTVSDTDATYDLIELRDTGALQIAGDSNVSSGTYDQIRLEVTSVTVIDSNGSHEAKLPSNELKINQEININSNETFSIKLDFIADESLHKTGNGLYILAPVIQIETRENASIEAKANGRVEIKSGKIKHNLKVGMDENGTIGEGVKIGINQSLEVGSDGRIKVGIGLGSEERAESENKSLKINTNTNANVNLDLSGY